VSRTGRVVPTVLYNPIELCGTSNQRVTGNNLQWLIDKGIHIGSDILVGKAGEIIPQILKVKSVSEHLVVVPTHCPICHTALERKSLDLICPGTECIPQLSKKLAYFYSDKGMDLKTIGEAMIIQLFEDSKALEVLNYAPWALLDPLSYDLTRSLIYAWGSKRYENYVQSLQDINGKKNQAQFMAALGYEKLAVKTVVKIFHALKGAKNYSHISAKALNNFVAALRDCDQAIKTMSNFTLLPIPEPPKVTYCITGELSITRSDIVDYLNQHGWQFTNQVSKFTDYLVVGETKNETTKMRKAKELKVPIIKEDTIAEILKEYTDERTNETDIPS
jgi:DNA ligase (NAD+)